MSTQATARSMFYLLHKFILRVALSHLAFAATPLFTHLQKLFSRLDRDGLTDVSSQSHEQGLIHGIASLSTRACLLYLPSQLRYKAGLHIAGMAGSRLRETLCKATWRNTIKSNFNLQKGKAGGEGNKVSIWGE